MKVYIHTDLEGIAGIYLGKQLSLGDADYYTSRLLFTEEVNAVVEGAIEGGADEIIVNDAHGGGKTLLYDKVHPGAYYVTEGNGVWLTALDESFDAVFLIGQHAMANTPDGILCHTQSSTRWLNYYINGKKMGEIGQAAVMAGYYRVAVVFVTGDFAACREAGKLLGNNIETVSVKKGYSSYVGKLVAPVKAREMAREGAKRAMSKIGKIKPYIVKPPLEIKLELQRSDYADEYMTIPEVRRINNITVIKKAKTALDILF